MSDWLTTGQMVDQLRVGQEAECSIGDIIVTKGEDGYILVKTTQDITYPLTMNFKISQAKWRLLPHFVSFWEAMHYVKKGKEVYFHPNENGRLIASKHHGLSWFDNYTWVKLLEGNWTVGE